MFKALYEWYARVLQAWGHPAVGLMMALESTVIPIPSEVIIPPAAHLAYSNPGGRLTIFGIIIAGTLGSWVGASIMYWVSRTGGRPLLARYGGYFGISQEKVAGAERWSTKFGSVGVFVSRLLPVVRHLIGIPAGLVRMHYGLFSLFTVIGSAVWCAVLCWVGIRAGQDAELMNGNLHRITIWLAGAVLVLGTIYYFFVHRHMKERKIYD